MEEAFSLDSNSSVKEFLPVHFGTMMRLFLPQYGSSAGSLLLHVVY
jgi:hypothetical protein